MDLELTSSSTDLTRALFSVRPGEGSKRNRTGLSKLREIERCRAEQDEILNREDVTRSLCVCGELVCICPGVKAWLVVLGLEDWECEKRLIEGGA
jgi:hypothetical protein